MPDTALTNEPKSIVCDGNEAAAWAVSLAKPDMVAVYPITPQSSLVEYVSQFIADGKIDADLMDVEGEHSVMSVLHGACLAGARTYTATCGPGLYYMFEPYVRTPGMRLPIVMSIVTRDGLSPQSVWGGQQDAMMLRETGWIQIYCESVQEVLDSLIMAFRIAEHRDVMLPVNICHDGNYLSYGITKVFLPEGEMVDNFLGQKDTNWHAALDPERPMSVDPLTGGEGPGGPSTFVRYRQGHCTGMQNALQVITETHQEWERVSGRGYAPLVEEYRLDDADYAIVTIGSMAGAGKDAVDVARDAGEKVGLIRIKTFRPFPMQALKSALAKVKAIGVVDRAVSFAWNCGPVFQDIQAAIYQLDERIPAISFIGGLAGSDIHGEHFARVIDATGKQLAGETTTSPVWLNEGE